METQSECKLKIIKIIIISYRLEWRYKIDEIKNKLQNDIAFRIGTQVDAN